MFFHRFLRRLLPSDSSIALYGDPLRWLVAGAAAVVLVAYAVAYAAFANYMFRTLHMNDFGKFYYSAQAFLDGGDMYAPSAATAIPVPGDVREFGNMNPPHFHLLLLPLARLSPLPALLTWAAASALALGGALFVIAREFGLRWTLAGVAWTVFGVAICSATGIMVVTGQLAFLLMLPVTLAWAAARHRHWTRAAAYLGIVASIKPFIAIFGLYFVLTRRVRSAVVMGSTAAACFLLGLVVFGWNAHLSWFNALSRVDWAWAPMNGSLEGLVARTFGESPFFVPAIDAPLMIKPIALVLSLLVAVGSLAILVRDQSVNATDRVVSGLILTALIASPLGWIYYVPLAAGPLTALWITRRSRPSPLREFAILVAVPGLLCPVVLLVSAGPVWWAGFSIGSLYTWTLLGLWAAVMFDATAARRLQ